MLLKLFCSLDGALDISCLQVLNYHPEVQAQYTAGTCRLSPLTSQFDMNNEDVKRQFMLAEQFSGPIGSGPHSATWKQQQFIGGVPSSAVMQQQVPAYRPMIDPAMAAAIALHEQQQALAMQQQQQQLYVSGDASAYEYYLASASAAAAAAQGHHNHTAAVAAAAAAMAAQRAASGLYPEPRMAY